MLRILLAQIATLGAFIALSEGNAYMAEGFGIHPIAAGALALLLIALPYMAARPLTR